jgi:hypothetical protein
MCYVASGFTPLITNLARPTSARVYWLFALKLGAGERAEATRREQ